LNPPSHFLVNAVIRRHWAGSPRMRGSAFLLGSVLPDVPLTLLWIGTYSYYRYLLGDQSFTMMDQRLDQLYFTNPFWIAAHNSLHSPTLLLAELALLWRFRDAVGTRRHWWFWFAAGCLIHTGLDIPTHVNDGPLLFFPLDWSTRFHSPISYWDRNHFGREFAIFELTLDLLLLSYLITPRIRRWLRRPARAGGAEDQP
jgi:hypothetical protein